MWDTLARWSRRTFLRRSPWVMSSDQHACPPEGNNMQPSGFWLSDALCSRSKVRHNGPGGTEKSGCRTRFVIGVPGRWSRSRPALLARRFTHSIVRVLGKNNKPWAARLASETLQRRGTVAAVGDWSSVRHIYIGKI